MGPRPGEKPARLGVAPFHCLGLPPGTLANFQIGPGWRPGDSTPEAPRFLGPCAPAFALRGFRAGAPCLSMGWSIIFRWARSFGPSTSSRRSISSSGRRLWSSACRFHPASVLDDFFGDAGPCKHLRLDDFFRRRGLERQQREFRPVDFPGCGRCESVTSQSGDAASRFGDSSAGCGLVWVDPEQEDWRVQLAEGMQMYKSFNQFGRPGKIQNVTFRKFGTPGKFEAKKLVIPLGLQNSANGSWGAVHTRSRFVRSLRACWVFRVSNA